MLKINFDNPNKEELIQECQEYILLLENSVEQLEEALTAECLLSQEYYGHIIFLEERVEELENGEYEK